MKSRKTDSIRFVTIIMGFSIDMTCVAHVRPIACARLPIISPLYCSQAVLLQMNLALHEQKFVIFTAKALTVCRKKRKASVVHIRFSRPFSRRVLLSFSCSTFLVVVARMTHIFLNASSAGSATTIMSVLNPIFYECVVSFY